MVCRDHEIQHIYIIIQMLCIQQNQLSSFSSTWSVGGNMPLRNSVVAYLHLTISNDFTHLFPYF